MNKELFFETIKINDGVIYNIEYHQERFKRTSSLHVNLQDYINPPAKGFYRCKLIYNAEEIINVEFFSYKKKKIHSIFLVECDDFEYSKKYLDRSKFDLFLNQQEADEILIIKNGFLTDTSIANIAFYDGEKWITPQQPLLEGTTRKRYLDKGFIYEENITLDMIKKFSKIAFLNAMIDFDIMSIKNSLKDRIIVK